jgi:hypothetical protein
MVRSDSGMNHASLDIPPILEQHDLKLSDIQGVIGTLHPLEGALEFLRELRATTQVIILSDTTAIPAVPPCGTYADLFKLIRQTL